MTNENFPDKSHCGSVSVHSGMDLFLFQYPVRPKFMTYDNVDLIGGRVKPEQKKVHCILISCLARIELCKKFH